jgi:hypothetical protein
MAFLLKNSKRGQNTAATLYNSVFSTMSQYLNKNYCKDRYTTVVGKGTFKKVAELLYFSYLKK